MTQGLPNESDVYKTRMRYRDKVEKMRKQKSRDIFKSKADSLSPGMGQGGIGGIDFSPTGGLVVFFAIIRDG